jgi:hypothetical protein
MIETALFIDGKFTRRFYAHPRNKRDDSGLRRDSAASRQGKGCDFWQIMRTKRRFTLSELIQNPLPVGRLSAGPSPIGGESKGFPDHAEAFPDDPI